MISVDTGCVYTQAHGCRFCLHIWTIALYFGRKLNGRGPRLEIATPKRWFRWSPGYREGARQGHSIVPNEELHRKVGLSNWLIQMRCHVIMDSCLRPDNWVCCDVDGDVLGRGCDYYEAIQNAKKRIG